VRLFRVSVADRTSHAASQAGEYLVGCGESLCRKGTGSAVPNRIDNVRGFKPLRYVFSILPERFRPRKTVPRRLKPVLRSIFSARLNPCPSGEAFSRSLLVGRTHICLEPGGWEAWCIVLLIRKNPAPRVPPWEKISRPSRGCVKLRAEPRISCCALHPGLLSVVPAGLACDRFIPLPGLRATGLVAGPGLRVRHRPEFAVACPYSSHLIMWRAMIP
jgi:hypothetical protein